MLRVNDIQTAFLPLIGWEQNYDTNDFMIASSLTTSESGYYYQQAHPLLTLNNLKQLAPDHENNPYSAYVPGTQYYKGNVVVYSNVIYRALADNINKQPDTNPSDWEVFNPFSEWLERKTIAGIMSTLQKFTTMKTVKSNTKSIFSNLHLYTGTGRLADNVLNTDSIVGFEIQQSVSKGLTLKIERIGLQFKGTGDVTIHVMHSSQVEPYKTITFTRTKDGSMEWFSPAEDLFLPHFDTNIDAGGSWYLVYNQSELPDGVEAINKDVDWSNGPCTSCGAADRKRYGQWSAHLKVYPIKAPGIDELVDPFEMWDINDNVYTASNNYGINLEISILCDLTDLLIQQKDLFVDALHKNVAASMLRELAYNPNARLNRGSMLVKRSDLLYEIDGDSQSMKRSGMAYEAAKTLKAVDLNTRGLSPVCLPCKKKGVRFKSIG